ncbi:hypothetical protein ACLOJK_028569 [Asimina triloba]
MTQDRGTTLAPHSSLSLSHLYAALLPLTVAPFSFVCVVLPSNPSPSPSLAPSASLPSALRFPTAATDHPSSQCPFASSLPSLTTTTTVINNNNSDASIFHHLTSLPFVIVDSGASIFHLPTTHPSSNHMSALLIFLDSLVPSLGVILLSVTLILAFGELTA